MSDPDLLAGSSLTEGADFRGYEVLRELGAGASGRVYKARKRSTGQLVALKLLRWRATSLEAVERRRQRFRREMYLCAHLSHPHIVKLIDHAPASDPLLYAVFEYVSGDTLEELLEREGALAPAEAARLMGQVLDALACAHARSIVHRDLKPANIVITASGARRHAMVLDFGLGGFAEERRREETAITRSRDTVGTPIYAAPEQLRGEPPTARADLYSWGLVLLECLTGRSAIDGPTLESVLHAQLGPDPIPVPEPVASGPLGPLIRAVTEKDPRQREVRIDSVLGTLDAVAAGPSRAAVPAAPMQPDRPAASPQRGRAKRMEQRQVTRMSCRFSVAVEEGAVLEPEDRERILDLHFAACREIVERRGGRFTGVVGSRILFAFGVPAREDAARRAVAAAQEAVEEIQRNPARDVGHSGIHVEIHVGVHTAMELVDTSRDSGPGETADVPLALDARAGPGEILLSRHVADLLRGRPAATQVEGLSVPELGPDREGGPRSLRP